MTISNWNSTASCNPTRVVEPKSVDHLAEIVRNTDIEPSPSPVRAVGSLHSLNPCFTTTGTLVQMKTDAFRYIREPGNDSVTVGAGVTMFELKEKLKPLGLQIAVTPEIGNATAGSVACCGTKDASLKDGPGQISSTVIGARIVDASGRNRPVRPDELHAFRSSYGLFGIVHEVTFETCRLQRVAYASESLGARNLPFSRALGDADGFLGFLLPYLGSHGTLVVERRTLSEGAPKDPLDTPNREQRTQIWMRGGYPFSALPPAFDAGFAAGFPLLPFVSDRVDTMIDFDRQGSHFFDFAFWAFPLHTWHEAIPAYVEFCHEFQGRAGFRPALPTEVYYIKRDNSALLSVSAQEDVFTLDMVHMLHLKQPLLTQLPLWDQMNDEFNEKIALPFGARPLLNQTKRLTRDIVERSLRTDWATFAGLRAQADRESRFLSTYFAQLGA